MRDDAESLYKQGIAKLREAQVDHSALIPATNLLAQAAARYEQIGDEAKVAGNGALTGLRKDDVSGYGVAEERLGRGAAY